MQQLHGLPIGLPIERAKGECMTRYPKNGRGAKWTAIALNAIKPDWKGDTLSDGEGLSGDVRFNDKLELLISFRYAFKWNGKVCWYFCGSYPANDLKDIREKRDQARECVRSGIDPRIKNDTDKIEARENQAAILEREAKRKSESLTIQNMMEAWLEDGVKRANNNKSITQSFNKHILPVIGKIEVRSLTEEHLSKIYKSIIKEGKNTTAFELSKDVHQMISWAEKRQPWRSLLANGNPASLIEIGKLLPDDFSKIRERTLSIDELKKLKQVFEEKSNQYALAEKKYGTERPLKKEVQIAMWLCLSTLCRIGELLMTEWSHVDFDRRTWFIPKQNTKKNGKKDTRTDHTVYLSDFALKQFKELHKLTGETKWAFPARYLKSHVTVKSASKLIGDRQVMFTNRKKKLKYRIENNSLVLGDQEWTPHDLRRTGATIMQGLLGLNNGLLISDLCLHHKVVTGSARHYLFEGYDSAMREGWQLLGDRLEAILNSDNVVSIESTKSA